MRYLKRIITCLLAAVLISTAIFSLESLAEGIAETETTQEGTDTTQEGSEGSGSEGEGEGSGEGEEESKEEEGASSSNQTSINVLLIGNSFTYYTATKNGIKEILGEMAAGSGKNIEITAITHGSAYLYYWAFLSEKYKSYYQDLYGALMGDTAYDYIVLQEQTTCGIEHPEEYLYPAVRQIYNAILKFQSQAKVILQATMGYEATLTVNREAIDYTEETMYDENTAPIYKIANELGISVAPIGMYCLHAKQIYPTLILKQDSGKHPTYSGYFVSAATLYTMIFGELPTADETAFSRFSNFAYSDISNDLQTFYQLFDDSISASDTLITLKSESKTVTANVVNDELSGSTIRFTSLNAAVAKVGSSTGSVTPVASGSTAIIAKTSSKLYAYIFVDVQSAKTPRISFNQSSYTIGVGDTFTLLPTCSIAFVPDDYSWTVTKKAVARVSSTGQVSALTGGGLTVTVKYKADTSIRASYKLYISCPRVCGVKIKSTTRGKSYGKTKLSWTKVTNATKYYIYRAKSKNGTYKLIGKATTNSYTDKKAPNNSWSYYKIKAISGSASTLSTSYSARVGTYFLSSSKDIVASVSKKSITIAWKKNSKATGYEIYRATSKNGTYKLIKTITKNTKVKYTDTTVKNGKKYYYKIRAYRTINGKTYRSVYFTKLFARAHKLSAKEAAKYKKNYKAFKK